MQRYILISTLHTLDNIVLGWERPGTCTILLFASLILLCGFLIFIFRYWTIWHYPGMLLACGISPCTPLVWIPVKSHLAREHRSRSRDHNGIKVGVSSFASRLTPSCNGVISDNHNIQLQLSGLNRLLTKWNLKVHSYIHMPFKPI